MQETREKHENAIFFTAQPPVPMSNPDFIFHVAEIKEAFSKKTHDTTVCSQAILSKLKVSIVEQMPEMPDDSYLEEFQDFIKKMPLEMSNDVSHFTDISFFNLGKHEMSPSVLLEKQKMLLHSNWLNQLELGCIIDYNNKKQNTVCRIRDAELQFQSGTSLRLTKITKLKVLFKQFQKCICLTYDEVQGKKTTEIKLRIFLENDTKDDLFIFMAKIIVEKLLLMDYEIDLNEGEDPECDKFIMKGTLLKKGQVLNEWNQRFMVLNDRIQSYKEGEFTFEMKNVKEIWTRFDVKDGKLVVKLRHGQKKTELGIPIVNYPQRFCKDNWLYRIYRLLSA